MTWLGCHMKWIICTHHHNMCKHIKNASLKYYIINYSIGLGWYWTTSASLWSSAHLHPERVLEKSRWCSAHFFHNMCSLILFVLPSSFLSHLSTTLVTKFLNLHLVRNYTAQSWLQPLLESRFSQASGSNNFFFFTVFVLNPPLTFLRNWQPSLKRLNVCLDRP